MLLPESYLQPNPLHDPKKAKGFITTLGIMYPLYVFFLYWLWYSEGTQNRFHFFNDNGEWLQMDKVGHFVVHFQWALMPAYIFCWAGYSVKQSALYSFLVSIFILMPVEVMDGFSAAWGFSWGDVTANLLGSLFAYVQLSGLGKIVAVAKYSFHTTALALVRPDMFGTGYVQNSLKDYNGQTYWLTIDVNAIAKRKILPSWLLLSIGYSGEDMYGGHDNVWTDKQGVVHDYSHIARYRQWYLSFDINFTPLIKNKVLQRVFYGLNIFKVPFPAVEFSERGIKFYWLYW